MWIPEKLPDSKCKMSMYVFNSCWIIYYVILVIHFCLCVCVLHRVCWRFDGHDRRECLCRPVIVQSWDSEDEHPAGPVFRIWTSWQGGGQRQLHLQIQSREIGLKPPYLPRASWNSRCTRTTHDGMYDNPYLSPKEAPAPVHKAPIS